MGARRQRGASHSSRSTRCRTRSPRSTTSPTARSPSSIYLALQLRRPLFLEGEAGVGKTEVAKVLARALGTRADPASVLRRARRQPRGLRVELRRGSCSRSGCSKRPAARRSRSRAAARAVQRSIPDQAAAAAGARAARGRAAGAADRRDRSRRRGVRGVPARAAVGLSGHDSRARHDSRGGRRRSSSSPRTGRAKSTTRSSGGASTQWIDYPSFEKERRIVTRRCPGRSARLAAQVTAFVQELRTRRAVQDRRACPRRSTGRRRSSRSTAESIDAAAVDDTLGVLLKHREDMIAVKGQQAEALVGRALARP